MDSPEIQKNDEGAGKQPGHYDGKQSQVEIGNRPRLDKLLESRFSFEQDNAGHGCNADYGE